MLAYPNESTNAVNVLTTYEYRGPFRVIVAAHVAPEQVSMPNMARRAPVLRLDVRYRTRSREVLVLVCSASVVSSSSFHACRTPQVTRQMGQHVLFYSARRADGPGSAAGAADAMSLGVSLSLSGHVPAAMRNLSSFISNRTKLVRNESCAQGSQSVPREAQHGDAPTRKASLNQRLLLH